MSSLPQLSLEEAQQRILADISPLTGETVDLLAAVGRVSATAQQARRSLPPFANSAMDGYAVRAMDTQIAPARLPVAGTVAAGAAQGAPLRPKTALRIFTGAPLP